MGRKRSWKRKHLYLCLAGLIIFFLSGCATPAEREKPAGEKDEGNRKLIVIKNREYYEHFRTARKLLSQRDYNGAMRENRRVLKIAGGNPPSDEALFNIALIHLHSGNPDRNLQKALAAFKKILSDFPLSPLSEQAGIWSNTLQAVEESVKEVEKLKREVEKARQEIEKSRADIEREKQELEKARLEIEKSRADIERAKQVDIEIEEKKKELLR